MGKSKILILVVVFICFFTNSYSYCDEIYEINNSIYQKDVSLLTTYVNEADCSFYISNGAAYCSASIKAVSGVTSTKLVLKLQIYKNDSWKTICTWSKSGGNSCSLTDQKNTITKGYKYRVYCEATAKTETVVIKSSSKSY